MQGMFASAGAGQAWPSWDVWLWVALLLGGLGWAAGAMVRRLTGRRRRRQRMRRAQWAEQAAERLLEAAGYEIVERQVTGTCHYCLDGVWHARHLRADLLVQRDGRAYVAEVKSGQTAMTLAHAPTRRQLLEYQWAFGVQAVLWVRPETGDIAAVVFPMTGAKSTASRRRWWAWLVCAVLLGYAVGRWL